MTIATFHNEQLIVAQNGEIISMGIKDTGYAPISLFNGNLIVKMATLGIWNLEKTDLKTVTSALMMK